MNAIKYFKLDLRVIKGKISISLILPILIGIMVMFNNNTAIMGIGFLLFLLIALATMPFDSEISEKSNKIYVMFPATVSNMVFGRFLYLIVLASIIFSIDGAIIAYLYDTKVISINAITGIFLSGCITVAICFCQYPVYYKFGIEKGKILSKLIYLVPGLAVFALTSVISEKNMSTSVSGVSNFIINNRLNLVFMVLIICIIVGMISYRISCNICGKKEL